MKAASAAGSEELSTLTAALNELKAIYEENLDGAIGCIAMTELCNALLEADALDTLSNLQQHADAEVSSCSSTLFQNVIPRIWSF